MDSRTKRQAELNTTIVRLSLLVVAMVAGMFWMSDAFADGPQPGQPATPRPNTPGGSVNVESGPNGVTIYIAVAQQTPGSADGSPSSGGAVSTGSQRSCTADAMNIGLSL